VKNSDSIAEDPDEISSLNIRFCGDETVVEKKGATLDIVLPVPGLNPSAEIHLNKRSRDFRLRGPWQVFSIPDFGMSVALCAMPVGDSLAETTAKLYHSLFPVVGGQSLYRIWNFVPAINEVEDNLENYRAFCLGRSEAFYERFENDPASKMPAASALGCNGESLVVAALFGESRSRNLENPRQIPAYRYPAKYGPRPPSFARGTIVERDTAIVFISGTSSVRGHESIGEGDIRTQTLETLTNLKQILAEAAERLSPTAIQGLSATYTVYLRNAEDRPIVEPLLRRELIAETDTVLWLKADICRRELDIEIEIALTPGTPVLSG